MKTPLIAGNWKMNKEIGTAKSFVMELLPLIEDITGTEILICPPFTALYPLYELLADSQVHLGAQDVFWEKNGAYTGEISAAMLIDAGCRYVIIGHSERRQVMGETDLIVNKKLITASRAGLIPILCIGETLVERKAQQAEKVVSQQLDQALYGLSLEEGEKLVIAYEPIWAIGTGMNASGQDAQEMSRFIRQRLELKYGPAAAQAVKVLYGGSVKEENIEEFMQQEDIDGALIGGASLNPVSLANIVRLVGNG